MRFSVLEILPLAGWISAAYAIDLDLNQTSSVDNALSEIAFDMMQYYKGNLSGNIPGLLPGPCNDDDCYYWWVSGRMWASLINYYQYTGDASYQPELLQGLAFQVGPDDNYAPPNQTKSLGIDDQAFWGSAAMEAAEAGLPNPSNGSTPAWIELAENVFNFQVPLWDAATCGGGFRWQIFSFNAGYNIKNAMSNGAFFQLAARLARYTGNTTYAEWADKTWDWMEASPLLQTTNDTLYIWDNTDVNNNCSDVEHYVWTDNYGLLLMGSAMMYNYTNGSTVWRERVTSIVDGALTLFFPQEYGSGIMSEILCESGDNCNNDQSTFKAGLSRSMAVASVIAPFTAEKITPKLASSAQGAAGQCVGGTDGRECGRQWYSTTWDGSMGVGQQMSALAVIGATRMNSGIAPLRAGVVSSSTGQPNSTVGNGSSTGSGTSSANSTSLPTSVNGSPALRSGWVAAFAPTMIIILGFWTVL